MSYAKTTLRDRTVLRKAATEKLRELPPHEGLGIALGIAVDLAKAAGVGADRFALMAYVAHAHCDGTQEEAVGAMQKALATLRAAHDERKARS